MAVFMTVFLTAAYAIAGIPAHFLLRQKGYKGWRAYALVGAVVGLLLSPMLQLFDTDSPLSLYSFERAARDAAMSAAFASFAASGFWAARRMLARDERPR